MVQVERIVGGPFDTNCYIVSRGGDAVLIDGDGDVDAVCERVDALALRVRGVFATHAHSDHVALAAALRARYAVPFFLHPADAALLRQANLYRVALVGESNVEIPHIDRELADSNSLRMGALAVDVVHTPGHTPGSVCLAIGDALFTGDTFSQDGWGRTDLPGGDARALERSIARMTGRFASGTRVWPGHGEPVCLGDVAPGDAAPRPTDRGAVA